MSGLQALLLAVSGLLVVAAILVALVTRKRARDAGAAGPIIDRTITPLFPGPAHAPSEPTPPAPSPPAPPAVATAPVQPITQRPAPAPPPAAAAAPAAPPPPPVPQAPAPVAEAPPPPAVEPAPSPPATPAPTVPEAPTEILVSGATISPLQYGWLFPDLTGLTSEEALTRHYVLHGRYEVGKGRNAAPDRLRMVEFQRLSPIAPNAPPSDFWRYVPGSSKTLNIICSHFAPPGQFGPTIPQRNDDPQIYIKYQHHEWYQRGVPGLTATIEDTARWLEAVAQRLGATRIRVAGFSAAAYGSILFGHLLGADAIYSVGPEFVLGRPHYRSSLWYPAREYHPAYQDLRPILPALKGRLALLFPAYDPMEFRSIQEARALGLDNLGMFVDFHPGSNGTDRPAMLAGPETLVPMARINPRPYAQPFDDDEVAQLATAYEAGIEGENERARDIMREMVVRHPRNHGFRCHLGVLEGLTGAVEEAREMIRAACAAMVDEYGGYGGIVARSGRPILRGCYRPPAALLRSLEPLFEDPSKPAPRPAEGAAPAMSAQGKPGAGPD